MRTLARARTRPRPQDLLSMAERMSYMSFLRAGFVAIVVIAGTVHGVRAVSIDTLLGVTCLYALLLLVPEAIRRFPRLDPRPVIGATLLLDGVYLAWVAYATGGWGSPLRFLIYVHVIAVTLVASYRTGLKIAAWHSLLLLASLYAQSGGILEVKETFVSALPGGSRFELVSAFSVTALWAVALTTAWLSAASEREVRGQKIDLEQLSEMVAEIDAREAASDIPKILLNKVCDVFGFTRGAVLASPKDDLSLMAYRGPNPPPQIALGLDEVMEQAWDRRRTMLVRQPDPNRNPRLAALLPRGRNLLIVPLFLDRGYRLGMLLAERGGKRVSIKRWVVAMVEQFASHAALALHNAWLLDEIQQKLEENKVLQGELLAQNLALESRVQERTSELSESLENLRVVDAQRRALLARLVTAEEEERQRIAGDIHDGPVQLLTAAGLGLETVRKRLAQLGQRDLNATVDEALAALQGSVEGMRTLTFELRPSTLDEEGLVAALGEYLQYRDPQLHVTIDNRLHQEPPEATRLILYRIAQEALVNMRKHAKATTVEILVAEHEGRYRVRVRDNGVGFDASAIRKSRQGHLGLSSMRERAEMAGGSCQVHSRPGGGTSVEFWLPGTPQPVSVGVDHEYAARGAA